MAAGGTKTLAGDVFVRPHRPHHAGVPAEGAEGRLTGRIVAVVIAGAGAAPGASGTSRLLLAGRVEQLFQGGRRGVHGCSGAAARGFVLGKSSTDGR